MRAILWLLLIFVALVTLCVVAFLAMPVHETMSTVTVVAGQTVQNETVTKDGGLAGRLGRAGVAAVIGGLLVFAIYRGIRAGSSGV